MIYEPLRLIALKDKFKELSEIQKVNVCNDWFERQSDEKIYWMDDELIDSLYGNLTVVEAYHEFIDWDRDMYDCWVRVDGYGNFQQVDESDFDEYIEDALNSCNGDLSFQGEVDLYDWDYETAFRDALSSMLFSEEDVSFAPSDKLIDLLDALNNGDNKERFIEEECDVYFDGDEDDARDEYVYWVATTLFDIEIESNEQA